MPWNAVRVPAIDQFNHETREDIVSRAFDPESEAKKTAIPFDGTGNGNGDCLK
jgi:hypothetical protein